MAYKGRRLWRGIRPKPEPEPPAGKEADKLVREIFDRLRRESQRDTALSEIAALPEGLLPTALQYILAIEEEELKSAALAALANRAESEAKTPIRKFAETVAQAATGPLPLMLLSLLFALAIVGLLGWGVWQVIPGLYSWGYSEFSWRSLIAWLPLFYLVALPLAGLALLPMVMEFWGEYGAAQEQVESAREAQERIEQQLSEDDPQKLVLIVAYSRQMLSEYYGIAMSQAQRSFRYCLIAMWIGFVVLLAGALDNFLPLRPLIIEYFEITYPASPQSMEPAFSPNDLVLITGIVIEFIAAAFLWVYRFSIRQQTYYYRRQLSLHNALLAQRLGEFMTGSKDAAIEIIVKRLLEDPDLQQMEGPSSSGLGKFLQRKKKTVE